MPTDKKTVRWYDQNARHYTAHVRDPKDSAYHAYYEKPAMYALLPILTGKTVLSLGCGSGEDSHRLKLLGAKRSVGIDISAGMITIAKKSHPDCEFARMRMESLDFKEKTFDLVYSSLAIHYLKDWSGTFQEAYRVLKPGGTFLFSCGHPIASAAEAANSAANLKVSQRSKTKTMAIAVDYLKTKKLTNALANAPEVVTWHKPISEIVHEARRAGFLIENLVEPRPLPAMRRIAPTDYEILRHIPQFVIFSLLKPGRWWQG